MIKEIKKIADANNGLIYTKDVTNAGLRREVLSTLVASKELVKVKRGVYAFPDEIVDEYFLLQLKASQLIYSHGTALYFLGYSNRVPNVITVTVKSGYNVKALSLEKVNIRYCDKKLFEIGLSSVKSPQGMYVRCYNIERTICDIVKDRKRIDPQIFSDAINQYFGNKKIDSRTLMQYSEKLGIKDEIMKYIEVLR